ncbi:hypothetical protein HBI56_233290 [Parastagonospora nodorum]|nr:hypothetical protein HBH54_134860 [Parastagonospora nodorum]KAH3950752.1 hypothetical protein HBH53_075140 [Parastagonospora nodorum]KAH4008119.1 hypothetical protein HBI13_241350 [Parastagonospora nodorum]KAH4034055.1 hypothetical protein HBI09_116190 [Parastagonospora nodorum]KAH4062059.1 hypothetical protein HBH50_213780 [Parastagonospora nodorum]
MRGETCARVFSAIFYVETAREGGGARIYYKTVEMYSIALAFGQVVLILHYVWSVRLLESARDLSASWAQPHQGDVRKAIQRELHPEVFA